MDRSVPVLLIALIALAGTGTAAVLSVYGTVGGDATLQQSVLVNGNNIEQTADGTGEHQALYSYDATGGELGQEGFSLANNADEPATVSIDTTVADGPNPDDSSPGDGVSISHLIYDQWTLSEGDSTPGTASVDVEATEDHTTAGDYAIHFESSESTSDYARVFFPASSVSDTDNLVYDGVSDTDNPVDDEVWLIMNDGTQIYTNGATDTSTSDGVTQVTYDLDAEDWKNLTGQSATPDFSDVVAVGIGQGAPTDPNSTRDVDTYVDNVRIGSEGDNPVDEQASMTLDLLPTGTEDHPVDGTVTSTYQSTVVTDVAINVYPGTYELETAVAPVTE